MRLSFRKIFGIGGGGRPTRLGSRTLRLVRSELSRTYGSGIQQPGGLGIVGTGGARPLERSRPVVLGNRDLARIANTDPIVWSIRRTLRQLVVQQKWDVVPDIDVVREELQRWREIEQSNLNPFGVTLRFESRDLPPKYRAIGEELLRRRWTAGLSHAGKVRRIAEIFETLERIVVQDQLPFINQVRRLLERPNADAETSLRALLDRVVDDLCVFDAAAMVKNLSRSGESIAELYELPGNEIVRYRNDDRSTPRPPQPAYLWRVDEAAVAQFTNDELIYLMMNPQQDGYGMSGIEAAIYIIIGSLTADKSNIDLASLAVMPPAIMDLGPNVGEAQRVQFHNRFLQEMLGPQKHRYGTIAGFEDFKLHLLRDRGSSFDMGLSRFLSYCIAVKCMCYGLSPQDVGVVLDFHRTTAEVQAELSKSRGVRAVFSLLESYVNGELVKPMVPGGRVKFGFNDLEEHDPVKQQQVDAGDLRAGIINRNERRDHLGMPPIPGGDVYTIESGMGLIPEEKLIDYVDQLRSQTYMQSQQDQGASGEGILPNSGLIPGVQGQEAGSMRSELGNAFADMASGGGQGEQQVEKVFGGILDRQRGWIQKALDAGDSTQALARVQEARRWLDDDAASWGIGAELRDKGAAWLADVWDQIIGGA